jgi:hypothetical protein
MPVERIGSRTKPIEPATPVRNVRHRHEEEERESRREQEREGGKGREQRPSGDDGMPHVDVLA